MLTSRLKGLEPTKRVGTFNEFLPTLVTACLSWTPSSFHAGFSNGKLENQESGIPPEFFNVCIFFFFQNDSDDFPNSVRAPNIL